MQGDRYGEEKAKRGPVWEPRGSSSGAVTNHRLKEGGEREVTGTERERGLYRLLRGTGIYSDR